MKLRHLISALLATGTLAAAPAANATEYLTGMLGWFDATQQDRDSLEYGAEYRFDPIWKGLRPTLGVMANTDEAVYGYAGLQYDFLIARQWYLSPSFAAGAYKRGDSKDLGGALEFRSGIELGYEFSNYHRLGVSFSHRSNANIYKDNPGQETLMLTYSIPMGNIFYGADKK